MGISRISAVLTFLLIALVQLSGWQNSRFPVDAIPRGLTENAGVVVRLSDYQLSLAGPGSLTLKCREVRTILRESGIAASRLEVGYNSLMKVSSISGTLYNASGVKIRSIRSEEIMDYSAFDGFSIYSDARVKSINPKYFDYPFTVEYEYQITFKTALYLPSFYVYAGIETSVEKAVYQLNVPAGFPIHFMEFNGMPRGARTPAGKTDTYLWQYDNLAARRPEPFSADPSDQYPYVLISPGEYSIEGFRGSMDSWEEFSAFCHLLLEGKQVIPEETAREIRNMVSGMDTDLEKVKAIYKYSQTKNRYVSIQKGIGGIVPFDAATVDRFSYGDCKALSNYVMSLLGVVDIQSYYTLVNAGEIIRPIRKEMVNDYFNHVIVCVPMNGDTVWLECTNPYAPVNYLGTFTDDRYVLVVAGKGGRLVKTPAYTGNDNSAIVSNEVKFGAEGKARIVQTGYYNGTFFGQQHSLLLMDQKDRDKAVLRSIPIPDISVSRCDISPAEDDEAAIRKRVEFDAMNCMTYAGNMIMFRQGMMSEKTDVPPVARRRESPVVISRHSVKVDSTRFVLPEGYRPESIPQNIEMRNEMAECSFVYTIEENRLLVVRSLRMIRGIYPAERFNDLRDLLEKVARKDDEMIVLVKII